MKKNYQKPAMKAVKIQQQSIICKSPGYEVIGTGKDNAPPGARSHSAFDEDDEWDD